MIPASKVWHKVSLSSGGESSPTTLYYGLRNTITVCERHAPLGPAGQANYLNQMVALETSLTPEALLDHLLRIERLLGRERGERWGPRTIDLDIVQFGNQVINSKRLTLPHPELPNRDFWQRELIELRGDWR